MTTTFAPSATTIDTLGLHGANMAMRGAAEYIRTHGLGATANLDLVVTEIKRRTPDAIAQAMDDARDAIEVGMKDAAMATFGMTFKLMGIEAARVATQAA